VSVAALSFVLGFVAVTGSYVMRLIEKTKTLQAVLVHFFRVQPPFLLGEGLIELTRYNFEKDLAAARSAGADSTGGADKALQQQSGALHCAVAHRLTTVSPVDSMQARPMLVRKALEAWAAACVQGGV
jgi:hypothetical protein